MIYLMDPTHAFSDFLCYSLGDRTIIHIIMIIIQQ